MKKVVIVLEGKTFEDLEIACEHARTQLEMGTVSENVTWDDKTHCDFQVEEIAEADSYADSCG